MGKFQTPMMRQAPLGSDAILGADAIQSTLVLTDLGVAHLPTMLKASLHSDFMGVSSAVDGRMSQRWNSGWRRWDTVREESSPVIVSKAGLLRSSLTASMKAA